MFIYRQKQKTWKPLKRNPLTKKTKYLHFIAHCLFVLAKGSFCLTKFLLLLTKMQPAQQQVAFKKSFSFLKIHKKHWCCCSINDDYLTTICMWLQLFLCFWKFKIRNKTKKYYFPKNIKQCNAYCKAIHLKQLDSYTNNTIKHSS